MRLVTGTPLVFSRDLLDQEAIDAVVLRMLEQFVARLATEGFEIGDGTAEAVLVVLELIEDIESERFSILTPGRLDESPSFAPNGSMILYATREGDRGVLSAVSADGSVRTRLILSEGDVREPAWSPVIR